MLSNKTCHSLIGLDLRANESQHGSAARSKYYGELDTSLVTPTCCKTLNAIWVSLRDSGTAVSTEGSERHGEHLPQPQKPHSLHLRCARCCSPGFIPQKTFPALWERTEMGFSSTWRKPLVFSPVHTPRDGFAEAGDRGTSTWQSKRSSPKAPAAPWVALMGVITSHLAPASRCWMWPIFLGVAARSGQHLRGSVR